MTGIPGLEIFVSDKGHGTMSLIDFANKGFQINDSQLKHFFRHLRSYPAFYRTVIKNRLRLLANCGIDPSRIFCPKLGLTDEIIVISRKNKHLLRGSGLYYQSLFPCDAVITDIPDLALMFLPADCPVVVLFDQKQHVLAEVHCGRENISQNIVGKVAKIMKEDFFCNPDDICVWFSPHLCKKCHILTYRDFLNNPEYKNIKSAIIEVNGGWSFDMRLAIEIQLKCEGISNIVPGPMTCTLCGKENLFSHRGWSNRHPDHSEPGRFAVISMITRL